MTDPRYKSIPSNGTYPGMAKTVRVVHGRERVFQALGDPDVIQGGLERIADQEVSR